MTHKTPKCHQCGNKMVHRIAPACRVKMRYEGSPHDVLVDDMPEWYCADCNVSVTDGESDAFLQDALRRHIGLLSPQQIRAGLRELRISQEKFAERLGCAAESVSRWLNGVVLQSRTYDRFMRIYFHFPEVRGVLKDFAPGTILGNSVVHAVLDEMSGTNLPVINGSCSSQGIQARLIKDMDAAFAACLASTLFSKNTLSRVRSTANSSVSFKEKWAMDSDWVVRAQFFDDYVGHSPNISTSRIPDSAWVGVGGDAA